MPSSHLIQLISVIPFSSCPQSLRASESFPMSHLFTWGGQSTGVSTLASFLPKNTQNRSPLEWTGWISLQFKDSQESSPTPQSGSAKELLLVWKLLCSHMAERSRKLSQTNFDIVTFLPRKGKHFVFTGIDTLDMNLASLHAMILPKLLSVVSRMTNPSL